MRSQREKRDSRCCRKGEEQPAVERRAAQARRRRPGSRAGSRGSIERAIAPEPARPGPVDPPRKLAMLYSMPRAYRIGSRRATSYAGSPPAASSKTRAEPRRAWRAHPHARGRRQARRACWRLCQAPACQKTPRSARDVTEAARLGAARAAGRRRHQARGRRAPPNRQGRRGSREHSTAIPFLWRVERSFYITQKLGYTTPSMLGQGGEGGFAGYPSAVVW